MRFLPSVLLALALASCGAPVALTDSGAPDSDEAARLLAATNAARAQARTCPDGQHYPAVPPVTYNALLESSARGYADSLAAHSDFPRDINHTDVNGHTFAQRIEAAGYVPIAGHGDYDSGENVQGGADSPEAAVAAWLTSPGHCANLMDADFTDMGMGRATNAGGPYATYWVQDLGRR